MVNYIVNHFGGERPARDIVSIVFLLVVRCPIYEETSVSVTASASNNSDVSGLKHYYKLFPKNGN
ncbi:hypothetical protein C349_04998 [Cryptococcus neoformans var. grubii Br795]|uniref:Uncharacterized protein n=1 Tax=Cryptococcus neoformans Tu259-1 TaxID=1230072 RepID=A0A854Q8G8_CRYNE|nr:hypothetical protein C353_04965 [Cryptococcus neoformans var. grubii AD1-83a]OWZ52181.1 hypothetical protein C368_05224 [Cryptococcus neoformans var. grubii 125.91]OXG15840.1 hypothetical protein C361_05282 [Cryptococcus neoformans var. grubii Tu259-1]OXG29322.1 hypothetical protein C360_05436 [Cryptococcus neoformans var. grubii Bt15]OXG47277.1 hypothetical protein C355_04934 [Cryptococcus neoformans var. grubii Th84]OXG53811.1 hypothetical protein C354_04902 [Cryptococcus neoformans var. 